MTSQTEASEDFRADLTALIPQMRAFARSMCGDATMGDDLPQDALLKALIAHASFRPGTNMKAWAFMIIRNNFLSDKRRSWRSSQLDPETAERTLIAVSNPLAAIELDELRRALQKLPDDQREALILIGAGGLSYEEVAEMTGTMVGTVKSRVSRARDRIALVLAEGSFKNDDVHPCDAMADILAQLQLLNAPLARAA